MIIVDNTFVSNELLESCFVCDIHKCKGICCIEGDAGAPLEEEEIAVLEDYLDAIKPFMEKAGIEAVEKSGVFDYDQDGSYVTPLIDNRACAFVWNNKGVALCAIERAWQAGKIPFRKPISCHLYPIRINKLKSAEAVNYHEWNICNDAVKKGKAEKVPLYQFLREPLIRKYGQQWYEKLSNSMNGNNNP